MTCKLKISIIIVKIVMLMLISGCLEIPKQNDSVNNFTIFFPTQKKPTDVHMLALLEGELINDNGCLRVKGYLMVWPYGYSFTISKEDRVIRIFDDKGNYVMRVGDKNKFGGGAIDSDEFISEYSAQLPNKGCPGPYWIVAPFI